MQINLYREKISTHLPILFYRKPYFDNFILPHKTITSNTLQTKDEEKGKVYSKVVIALKRNKYFTKHTYILPRQPASVKKFLYLCKPYRIFYRY